MARWLNRPRSIVPQRTETVNYVQDAIMELLSTDHDTVRVMLPEHAKLAALLRVFANLY